MRGSAASGLDRGKRARRSQRLPADEHRVGNRSFRTDNPRLLQARGQIKSELAHLVSTSFDSALSQHDFVRCRAISADSGPRINYSDICNLEMLDVSSCHTRAPRARNPTDHGVANFKGLSLLALICRQLSSLFGGWFIEHQDAARQVVAQYGLEHRVKTILSGAVAHDLETKTNLIDCDRRNPNGFWWHAIQPSYHLRTRGASSVSCWWAT